MKETQVLHFPPDVGNGVQWNPEDATVGVAAGSVVVLFNPSRCNGPMAYAIWKERVPHLESTDEEFHAYEEMLREEGVQHHDAEGTKKANPSSKTKTSAAVGRGREYANITSFLNVTAHMPVKSGGIPGAIAAYEMLQDAYWSIDAPQVRALAWSPSGLISTGGCLLSVIFDDESVMLFSPPHRLSPKWLPLINLAPTYSSLGLETIVDDREDRFVEDGDNNVPKKRCDRKKAGVTLSQEKKKKNTVGDENQSSSAETSVGFHNRILDAKYQATAWSGPHKCKDGEGNSKQYSLVSVVSRLGNVHIWRILHVEEIVRDFESPSRLKQRIEYIGTVEQTNRHVLHVKWISIPGTEKESSRMVCIMGCLDGSTVAWGTDSAFLGSVSATTFGYPGKNLVQQYRRIIGEETIHSLIEKDNKLVCSLDACIRWSPDQMFKLVVAVGKTVGGIQVFLGGPCRPTQIVNFSAIFTGSSSWTAHDRMDHHSISGLALVSFGAGLIAGSRLGNISSWSIPWCLSEELPMKTGNPVHFIDGNDTDSYKGYGCYGISPSPGGNFVAVAKQSMEPGIEFSKQLQIHQRVTQGYTHLQSIVGPGALRKDTIGAIEECIRGWIDHKCNSTVLWDVERLAYIAQRNMEIDPLSGLLKKLANECQMLYGVEESTSRHWRLMAALIRLLKAVETIEMDGVPSIGSLETQMLLQQARLIMASVDDKDEDSKHSALLAADFVQANSEQSNQILLNLCREIHSRYGDSNPIQPVERSIVPGKMEEGKVPMDSGGATGALTVKIPLDEENSMTLTRCPNSFLVNIDGGQWCCSACSRAFQKAFIVSFVDDTCGMPICPLCAGHLGPSMPDILFTPPCA